METKLCSTCKISLPFSNFASRISRGKKKEIIKQSNCKACQKNYRKEHYLNNKQKYIDQASRYRKEFVKWFAEYKSKLNCKNCGDTRYWVLDFHHNDPNEKDNEVSNLVRKCSKDLLLKEIEKCSILCANCHRDFHYQQNKEIILRDGAVGSSAGS